MISGLPRNPQVDAVCTIFKAAARACQENTTFYFFSKRKNGAEAPFFVFA
jgi:hypothetical protein